MQFTRLGSSSVLAQAHASEDSRFLILPVIETAATIRGWVVYDTHSGQVRRPSATAAPEGFDAPTNLWEKLYHARNWISTTFYGGE